jgi:hypothetical protein
LPSTRKIRSLGAAVALAAGLAGASLAVSGPASAAPAPLPPYPATITLNLGSPFCITDDVIMNDPLDSTSPITDTYGSAGTVGAISHATPPVRYYLWYLNTSNVWQFDPPPGTQINPNTGVIAAYGPGAPLLVASPLAEIPGTFGGPSSVTYTVRDHGKDSVGAVGTEQFQIRVDDTGTATTVLYEGNTFNNANGALTIGLNAGSTDSTALTLAAIPSSLDIPGSTPVTFTLAPGSPAGWTITGNVLTGVNTRDPEIIATTANHDVVYFTLSGISTDAGGVFFTNTDANPCVTVPAPAPAPTPTTTATTPPPPASAYGNEVNQFGNGLDVDGQHAAVNTPIIVWPATQADPATHFLFEQEGSFFRIEYAPFGTGTGLCVSNPFPSGSSGLLELRGCNPGPWQQFSKSGALLISRVNGGVVNPHGKGSQWSTAASAVPWGGSNLTFEQVSSLP